MQEPADNSPPQTPCADDAESLTSAIPVTPMLEFLRSVNDPGTIVQSRLSLAVNSTERNKISVQSVTVTETYQSEKGGELWEKMSTMPSGLSDALTLPKGIRGYGSARELFDRIVALLRHHVPLVEKDCVLVAYWSMATWFLDFLPFLPTLVVTGSARAADRLLRTLVAVCRRPWALADLNSATLLTLPLVLKPTLLICKPQLNRRLAALLDASNQPGYLASAGKNFHELYCAKCIYIGEHCRHVMPNGIHVHVEGKSRRVLLPLPIDSVIDEFQGQLLFYRFVWRGLVAASKFRVPQSQFGAEVAGIAQVLGATVVSEPELQRGIMELLQERDEQSRVDRSTGIDGVVLRALLSHCHQPNQQKVFVRDIAAAALGICREEGESLHISSGTAGHALKNLGLYTRRLGSAGRGFILDRSTQSQVHRLAYAYDVLPEEPSCGYCHSFQASQTGELVQEV
jgi:hypothetical protein